MQSSNTKTARATSARRRSAELHSAVSQICNLQGVKIFQRPLDGARPAECNSAIRQIENLRYVAGASPRQALLHFQSSGAAHSFAFNGLFVT